MGTEIKEIVEYIHECDTCSVTATTTTTELPEGWLGVGSRSIEFGTFDIVLCGTCTDIACLHMIQSKEYTESEGLPWLTSLYAIGDLPIRSRWSGKSCPRCHEEWDKGDPLGFSEELQRWVHWSCR